MTEAAQAFSIFMDSAKMKAIFQKELPNCWSKGWRLTDCQIQHPRYKTYLNPNSQHKSYLAATYHLRGINKLTSKSEDKILYVKAFLGERSYSEYEKACVQVEHNEHVLLHIEKYGMIVWYFPNDPGIADLAKVMDVEAMRRYFVNFLMASKDGGVFEVKDIALQIINYRPEIRCTFRYDLETPSGSIMALYGKTFSDERGAEIHRRISTLLPSHKNNSACFALPNPIGYDTSLQTLWVEGLNGSPLLHSINQQNAERLMSRLAKYLVYFHYATLEGLEVNTEENQLSEIQKKSAKLQSAFPGLSQRIGSILAELKREIEKLPDIPNQLIHGDFHVQQLIMLFDSRIALFDFDELALANPLVDVANFSADLHNLNLGKKLTEWIIHSFVKAYKAASSFEISNAHFNWHYKVQLITRAYRAYIQQKSGLEQIIEQFVTLAESGYIEKHRGY
jgi:Phosphotransferase enzyme family